MRAPSRAPGEPAGRREGPAEPLRFRPILKEKVWGGRRLFTVLGKPLPGEGPYGESWEISDFGEDRSVVDGGPWNGFPLRSLIESHPREVLGRPGRDFPLLIKSIDAAAPLSVQLHPEGGGRGPAGEVLRGKTEAWVILDVDPGARIVYGLAPGVGLEELFRAAESGRASDIEPLLGWREVRPGDLVFLPPGTIHAIGGGILLLEVQESCDTTYRIYDWGRPGLDGRPRQLHLAEARGVRPPPAGVACPFGNLLEPGSALGPILENPIFRMEAFRLGSASPLWRTGTGWGKGAGGAGAGFLVLGGVRGRAAVRGLHGEAELEIGPGEFVLVPAATEEVEVRSRAESFIGLCVREGPAGLR